MMEKLAYALLDLNWSEMDGFAQLISSIATQDDGTVNDERWIAQALIDWADEIVSETEPDD